MKNIYLYLLALISFSHSFFASGALPPDTLVISDSNGMPWCWVQESKPYFVRFIWNRDPFTRKIFYEILPVRNPLSHDRDLMSCASGDRQYLSESFAQVDAELATWRKNKVRFLLAESTDKITVHQDGQQIAFEASLTPEMKALFAQVRLGANVAPKNSPDPLTRNFSEPIRTYNLQMNRDLTARFGAGHSIDVYQKFIDSQPRNSKFKRDILDGMKDQTSLLDSLRGKSCTNHTIAAFVMGFGHTLGGNDRYDPFVSDLRNAGMDTRILYTQPYGRTDDNVVALRYQLNTLSTEQPGKKILLFSASNGTLQTVGAVASLGNEAKKKIGAFISLSGVYSGSFAADWATEFPQWIAVKSNLLGGLAKQNIFLDHNDTLESFKDLRTDFVSEFMQKHAPNLPQNTVYVNLIGTPSGDGVVKDPSIGILQRDIVRPRLSGYGANDGYFEFPGTALPPGSVKHLYQTTVDASHAILEGKYNGIDLQVPENRRGLVTSLLKEICDRVEEVGAQ